MKPSEQIQARAKAMATDGASHQLAFQNAVLEYLDGDDYAPTLLDPTEDSPIVPMMAEAGTGPNMSPGHLRKLAYDIWSDDDMRHVRDVLNAIADRDEQSTG